MSDQINIVIADKNLDTKVLNGLIVKSEVNANTIEIEFPQIYDGENLENKIFVIKAVNANGVYFEEILPKTIAENKIILTWKIGSEYTSVSGDLRVAIFAEGTNYVLGTKTAKVFIENSPQFTAPISPEDVFENYLKEIRVRSESAANSAEQSLKILTDMNSKIVDDFTSTAKDKALSANKGRELNTRIDNIVAQTGTSNTEVVDARNSPERNTIYPTLKARLDAVDGDMVKSKFSVPTTATAPIISLPSTAVKGKMEGSIKGNTLYNAVVNGDFSNGTIGWTPSSATPTVTNKVLSVTGTGASATVGVSKLTTLNSLTKRFAKVRVRVTNANCQSILFRWSTSVADQIAVVNNPVKDQWYELTGILERNLPILYMYHTYPDAVTANGKVMEVDGNAGVFAIPITGTPYENWTADQLNNLINGYWEGLGNSKPNRAKSVGKNLIEKTDFANQVIRQATSTYASRVVEENKDCLRLVGNAFYLNKSLGFKFKPNTQYRIGIFAKSVGGTGGLFIFKYTDETSSTIPVGGTIGTSFTSYSVVSTIGKTIKDIGFTYNTTGVSFFDLDTLMLSEGSTALPYEPYQETELFCSVELGSVPSVQDEFTFDGKYIQKTKEYTLQSVDITALKTDLANLDYVRVKKPLDYKYYNTFTMNSPADIIVPNFSPLPYADNTNNVNTYNVNATATEIFLGIPKGTYTNLAAAQTALAGTKIRYQLATPIETQYPASNLIAEPSGTIYIDNVVKVVKPYKTNIALAVKIKNLTSVTKVDGETRSPILLSLVNVAADGMYLTVLNASSGDMYELEYETFGVTLPTVQYSYPSNLNAQIQGNTDGLKAIDKKLQDFLAYQNAVNAQVDLRLVLLERM